jgi:CheY-like chemotaxis protein
LARRRSSGADPRRLAEALLARGALIAPLATARRTGHTGLELTCAIREDPDLAKTCVILLTSKAQQADVQAGLNAGADRYLPSHFRHWSCCAWSSRQ